MTRLVTPAAAEAELRRVAHKLEERTDALAGLLQAAADADVAYRLEHARVLLAADGSTVAERQAAATLAVADEPPGPSPARGWTCWTPSTPAPTPTSEPRRRAPDEAR